jgi:hypothetical protein
MMAAIKQAAQARSGAYCTVHMASTDASRVGGVGATKRAWNKKKKRWALVTLVG